MMIMDAHREAMKSGYLPIFTVYDNPTDVRGFIVVRMYLTTVEGTKRTDKTWTYLELKHARSVLEDAGLYCMGRKPDDDPCIVESWL